MIDRLTKTNGHRWTNEEIRKLMRMWADESTLSEIAEALSVTKNAAQKMVVRLRQEGIPLKKRTSGHVAGRRNTPWSQAQIEYLIRRRSERATAEEIADDLGRTACAINAMIQTLRKEGVPVPEFGKGCHRKWNPTLAMAALDDNEPKVIEMRRAVGQ